MAKPRIFVSSTYYDLKNVRLALSYFIRELGYDSVRNEEGQISYAKSMPLEDSCYDEVSSCDILVSIIGGRFGSKSKASEHSVSQSELRTALSLDKQVYVFIESDVYAEYSTYEKNKEKRIRWAHVDNDAIFSFIEEVRSLSRNNAIFPFSTSQDIISILREQWAGLFQRMLNDRVVYEQVSMTRELTQGVETLRKLISTVGVEGNEAAADTISTEHPLFMDLRKLLAVGFRVFFTSEDEMRDLIRAMGWARVKRQHWDEEGVQEWVRKGTDQSKPFQLLKISSKVFDKEGRLKPFDPDHWDTSYLRIVTYDPTDDSSPEV